MSIKKINSLIKQGYLCLQKNDLDQALIYFKKAKAININSYDVWCAIGRLYMQMNSLDDAAVALQKATEISPENYMAHGQLGVVLYSLQRQEEAIACYKKVITLQPNSVTVYANLAIAYIDLGLRDKAILCCKNAIKIKPEFATAHILLAASYSALGLYEKALNSYNNALLLERESLDALAGKADSLIKLGRKKEAHDIVYKKIEMDCTEPSIVTAYAATCTSDNCRKKAVGYLEHSLKMLNYTQMQKLQLHFSAGNLYDRLGQYDLAFKHYLSGNNLAKRNYSIDSDNHLFDNLMSTFTRCNMKKLPRAQQHDLVPVFIIGMPRSGTSLVEKILGSHSKIYPAGELSDIPKIAEQISMECLGNSNFSNGLLDIDENLMNQLSHQYLKKLSDISSSSNLVTDKLPHNFLFLGLIELLWPNAKIIHCKRAPLDTCLSNYFQYFSGPLDYPYDLKSLAMHYNHYQRIMDHWKETTNLPMLEVTYEELVCKQEVIMNRLLSFLDLSWEDSCIKFDESEQVTRTASYDQVREPIYSRSIGRWRHYEKHIGELIDNLVL